LFICGKTDLTADLVLLELKKREKAIPVLRFNVDDYPSNVNLSASYFKKTNTWGLNYAEVNFKDKLLDKIKSVYCRPFNDPVPSNQIKNRIHKKLIIEQSAIFINWLPDILDCFWLNNPRAMERARSKALQLKIAAKVGFLTPDSLITNNPDEALFFYRKNEGKIAAKLLQATPASRQLSGFIYTKKLTEKDLRYFDQIEYSPVLLQEYVDKKYEIRATVVGNKVFSARIDSQVKDMTKADWRCYEFGDPPPHKAIELPLSINQKLIKMNKELNLEFGAYDLIYTPKKTYVFLEVNANGQWGWIQELTKLPISTAIADLLIKNLYV